MKEVTELYNQLVDGGQFTDGELQLATYIGGYTIETLNACVYYRYGYHSLEHMEGYE